MYHIPGVDRRTARLTTWPGARIKLAQTRQRRFKQNRPFGSNLITIDSASTHQPTALSKHSLDPTPQPKTSMPLSHSCHSFPKRTWTPLPSFRPGRPKCRRHGC